MYVTVADLFCRYFKWSLLETTVLLHYRNNLRRKYEVDSNAEIIPLSVEKMRKAETEIVKYSTCEGSIAHVIWKLWCKVVY